MKKFLCSGLKDKLLNHKQSLRSEDPKLPINLLLIGLIPFVLVLFWFRSGDILGSAEAEIPFYRLSSFATTTTWSWGDAYLGYATGLTTASFPTWWMLSEVQNIGIPGYIIQATLFWLLFVAAGIGIYSLAKLLFPDIQRRFLLLAAFFYWFNPISFVSVWNRFLINFMFFWSLFPLALFVFIKGLKTHNYRWAILTIIVTLLFSYTFSSIVFTLLLWFCFFYTTLFFLIFYPGKRSFYLKYASLSLILFLLFHFWWISQYLSFIFSSSLTVAISSFFSTEDNLLTLAALSEKLGKLIYSLRFLPGSTFDMRYGQTLLSSFSPFNTLQYLFPIVILWTIYKYRKNQGIILAASLYFIALFLIKGQNSPFGEIFQFIFIKVIAFQAFRDPFEKFAYLLLLSSTLIFTFGIGQFSSEVKNKIIKEIIYHATIIFIIIIWGFPFYTGRVFSRVLDDKTKQLISYEVRVPSYYKAANDWLNDQKGEFRFISLPLGQEGMTYKWEKSYSGVEISRNLFDKPNISFNTTMPLYNNLVANLSKYQIDENIFKYVPLLNSRYIVLRSDIDFKERHVADPSTVKDKLNEWVEKGLLTKGFEKGNIIIYEISDMLTSPKIFVTPNLLASNVNDLVNLTSNYSDLNVDKTVILNFDSLKNTQLDSVSKNLIIVPTKAFLPHLFFAKRDFTEEDLLARLFHVQHLPTEKYYPLVRIKEILQAPSQKDYLGRVLYKTGILGKRAVEIYKLHISKASISVISKAEKDYLQLLLELMPDFKAVLPSDNPVSEVIKESLVYQSSLLDKTSAENSKKKLSEILLNQNIIYNFELPVIKDEKYIIYSFNIPRSDKYYLRLDKAPIARKWFVDGVERGVFSDKNSTSNLEIYLAEGMHEFAISVAESDYFVEEAKWEQLGPTDKSNFSTRLNLPDTETDFQLDFDYLFRKGDIFQLRFIQNIDKPQFPVLDKSIVKDKVFHEWQHATVGFRNITGAKYGYIETQSLKDNICKTSYIFITNCFEKDIEYEVAIRNLKVRRVNYPNLTLSNFGILTSKPLQTTLEWLKVNPTLYLLKINKKENEKEAIVFSELYDSRWKMYQLKDNDVWNKTNVINNWEDKVKELRLEADNISLLSQGEEIIDDKQHFWSNFYANSWVIDRPGEYNLMLTFAPEQNYFFGKLVSVVSISSVILYLLIKSILWRKREN